MVKARLAADFTGWETDNAKYEEQLERVVKALRTGDGGREMPPGVEEVARGIRLRRCLPRWCLASLSPGKAPLTAIGPVARNFKTFGRALECASPGCEQFEWALSRAGLSGRG